MGTIFLVVFAAQDICHGMFIYMYFELICLHNFHMAEVKVKLAVISRPERWSVLTL